MKVTRRTLLGTIAAGFAAGPHFPASAEGDWPSRVVRLVSPYGAGGASDISLRILAEQIGRSLNQQFIVENKPGAGTRVANELVHRQPFLDLARACRPWSAYASFVLVARQPVRVHLHGAVLEGVEVGGPADRFNPSGLGQVSG